MVHQQQRELGIPSVDCPRLNLCTYISCAGPGTRWAPQQETAESGGSMPHERLVSHLQELLGRHFLVVTTVALLIGEWFWPLFNHQLAPPSLGKLRPSSPSIPQFPPSQFYPQCFSLFCLLPRPSAVGWPQWHYHCQPSWWSLTYYFSFYVQSFWFLCLYDYFNVQFWTSVNSLSHTLLRKPYSC